MTLTSGGSGREGVEGKGVCDRVEYSTYVTLYIKIVICILLNNIEQMSHYKHCLTHSLTHSHHLSPNRLALCTSLTMTPLLAQLSVYLYWYELLQWLSADQSGINLCYLCQHLILL